ncbi:MAG TPA: SMP-30/gluconolactonase/LRE family protein [Ferrovibrio sp.]|uniref:SMP-30/gluconolactonase/LRE family protein n=1 Tax=Ferrovibrio sp. TaxID=1917215 RepID=UPI002ED21652
MPPRKRSGGPAKRGLRRYWWRFLLVALIVYAGYTVWNGGALRSTKAFVAGQCLAVEAPVGPEDLVMLPDGSGAIVSAQDRRHPNAPGALWYYSLNTRPGQFTKLGIPANLPLHPGGISLFRGGDGQIFLHVINHRSEDRHTVEIFTLQDDGNGGHILHHRGSVSSSLFVHPNAIAAVGPEAFYVTNDRGSGPHWMHMVENLLQLSRATVDYYDGRGVRIVAKDIAFANGIDVTADGGTVLVGSTLWRELLAFTRDPGSGFLLRSGTLALPGGPDNIHRDAEGNIWVAAHPNAFAFIGHAIDGDRQSPSMVLRIGRGSNGVLQVQEAFGDPGSLISGASAAAQINNRLLIGATFQPKLLDCQFEPAKLRSAQ